MLCWLTLLVRIHLIKKEFGKVTIFQGTRVKKTLLFTSYVDGDNRRTWNSLIYSRFLVIGFHKSVDTFD